MVKLNGEEINAPRDVMVTAAKQILSIVSAFHYLSTANSLI